MQLTEQGEGRFTVQLTDVPVIALENQLAGKKNAVREILADSFRQFDELFDRVRAEGEIGLGWQGFVMAKVYEIVECGGRLLADFVAGDAD